MIVDILAWTLVTAFPLSEIVLALLKRAKPASAKVADRGSMRILWLTVVASLLAANAFQSIRATRLIIPAQTGRIVSLVLLAGGLAIRWWSIFTLGRLFTVDVAIHQRHPVIKSGLYKRIRHPSYAGLLLAFLGLGVLSANWLSLAVLMVPIAIAVMNRIRKEEDALRSALGAPYSEYCAATKRLIPWII